MGPFLCSPRRAARRWRPIDSSTEWVEVKRSTGSSGGKVSWVRRRGGDGTTVRKGKSIDTTAVRPGRRRSSSRPVGGGIGHRKRRPARFLWCGIGLGGVAKERGRRGEERWNKKREGPEKAHRWCRECGRRNRKKTAIKNRRPSIRIAMVAGVRSPNVRWAPAWSKPWSPP